MKKKNQSYINKEAKQIKKVQRCNDLFEACTLFGGITCAFALVATLMGGAAAITSDITMNETAQAIYASDGFQNSAREKLDQLSADLAAGKISYAEYESASNSLYSVDSVIEYSKTANDKDLNSFLESYYESKDLANATFTKGVPVFAGTTAVAAAGAAAAYSSSKKNKKKLEEMQAEAQPQA